MKKGKVRVLHQDLQDLLFRSGLTLQEVKEPCDDRTKEAMLKGAKPVKISSVATFVRALGEDDFYKYIVPEDRPGAEGNPKVEPPPTSWREIHEWVEEDTISDWRSTSNGLQYQILKMRHRDDPGLRGRGKLYDLRAMPPEAREARRQHVLRHPKICRQLAKESQFPINEKIASVDDGRVWWVIDGWIEGRTLEEWLEDGPLPAGMLAGVMKQIAEGLATLHRHEIIRRELSPEYVILAEPDHSVVQVEPNHSVVLTDFELGKLLDGTPTVSGQWGTDGYRAPEVAGGDVDKRADIYSWGRILVHAAVGKLPDSGEEIEALEEVDLTPATREIVSRCLQRSCEKRPDSIDDVFKAIKRWK